MKLFIIRDSVSVFKYLLFGVLGVKNYDWKLWLEVGYLDLRSQVQSI